MEIPSELKKLYNHWLDHTKKPSSTQVILNDKVFKNIEYVCNERMRIWEKKEKGLKPPFTKDPILNKFKFCNIYRELDRQTIEIHTLLKEYTNNFPLWLLNIMYCRFVCRPGTIKQTGLLSFDKKNNQIVMERLLNLNKPKYGNAYIFPISLLQRVGIKTREEFFCLDLPLRIQKMVPLITAFKKAGVNEALKKLLPVFGLHLKFHFTEVLIDVAYQYQEFIDLYKEFPIGPGSIPTMNLLNPHLVPEKVNQALIGRELKNFPYLTLNGKPIYLSAENWEGIGCEYRKYLNLSRGTGRKRLYKLSEYVIN